MSKGERMNSNILNRGPFLGFLDPNTSSFTQMSLFLLDMTWVYEQIALLKLYILNFFKT